MIVPWRLVPAGEATASVSSEEPTTLTPPSDDIVAVVVVVESPPIRVSYSETPSFAPDRRGVLLKDGEHLLTIVQGNPLQLLAQEGEASISLIWLKRREP